MSGGLGIVPGLSKPPPERTTSYQRNTGLASWMGHDMRPKDPYGAGRVNPAEMHTSKPMPAAVVARGPGYSITSEMNTGGDSHHYMPLHAGDRTRRYGYFRNPDMAVPRQGIKVPGPAKRYARSQILGKPVNVPPRHEPGNVSDFYSKGLRASDSSNVKIYHRSKDEVWEKSEQYDRTHLPDRQAKEAMMPAVQAVAKKQEQQKREQAREKREDYERNRTYDPHKKFSSHHLAPMGDRAEDLHLIPDTKLRSYERQQANFEADFTESYAGKAMGKQGGGAPQRDKDGKIITKFAPEAETHLHFEYTSTQESASATMKYDPADRAGRHRYGQELKKQIRDNESKRRAKRAGSAEARKKDDGGIHFYGRAGAGAPNRLPDGRINVLVQGGHDEDYRTPKEKQAEADANETLSKSLQSQINTKDRTKRRQRQEKLAEKYEYDIYGHGRVTLKDGERVGHVKHATAYGMSAPDVEVAESSLINVMGKAGGGAPIAYAEGQRRTLPVAIEHEAFDIEMQAQKDGTSDWNKQGGGGPVLKPDGSIFTKTLGRAEKDASGESAFKGRKEYKQHVKIVSDSQEAHRNATMEAARKAQEEERRIDKEVAKIEFMPTDYTVSEKVMAGYCNDRQAKSTILEHPDLRVPPNFKDARALDNQIEYAARQRKIEQQRDRELDRLHNAHVMDWQGKGAGKNRMTEDGDISGRRPGMDPLLHYHEIGQHPHYNKTREEKAKYAADLSMQVTDRKRKGFFNRWRKKKEEVMHMKTAEEEAVIREERRAHKSPIRHLPKDQEYRMLAKPTGMLA